jgi:hypothetical protein
VWGPGVGAVGRYPAFRSGRSVSRTVRRGSEWVQWSDGALPRVGMRRDSECAAGRNALGVRMRRGPECAGSPDAVRVGRSRESECAGIRLPRWSAGARGGVVRRSFGVGCRCGSSERGRSLGAGPVGWVPWGCPRAGLSCVPGSVPRVSGRGRVRGRSWRVAGRLSGRSAGSVVRRVGPGGVVPAQGVMLGVRAGPVPGRRVRRRGCAVGRGWVGRRAGMLHRG